MLIDPGATDWLGLYKGSVSWKKEMGLLATVMIMKKSEKEQKSWKNWKKGKRTKIGFAELSDMTDAKCHPNLISSISLTFDSRQTLFLKSPVSHPPSHQKCPKSLPPSWFFPTCSQSREQFSTIAINAKYLLLSMFILSLSHSLWCFSTALGLSSFLPFSSLTLLVASAYDISFFAPVFQLHIPLSFSDIALHPLHGYPHGVNRQPVLLSAHNLLLSTLHSHILLCMEMYVFIFIHFWFCFATLWRFPVWILCSCLYGI